jgi:hypothetical protein
MNINRHNYEEYFILYSDNELSSDDRRRVDEFVFSNPDLKDEFDTYLNLILTTDISLKFENKNDLHRYDESLISYLDNELPGDEKKKFEELIGESPRLQNELNLYRKTKLQPEAEIVFENKSVLYRGTEKRRVVPMRMMQWAAAAAILIAVSLTAINYFNKKSAAIEIAEAKPSEKKTPGTNNPADKVAVKKEVQENESPVGPDKKSEQLAIEEPGKVNNLALKTGKQKQILPKEIKLQTPVVANEKKKDEIAINKQPPSNNLPSPLNNPLFNVSNQKKNEAIANVRTIEKKENVNETLVDRKDVTISTAAPLYISSTNIDTELNTDEEGKNKKSRGLLRKITRLFEKNTGIKATDDDKLRIAAFTVKL